MDKQHLSISEAVTLGIEDGIKPMRSGVSIQIEKGEYTKIEDDFLVFERLKFMMSKVEDRDLDYSKMIRLPEILPYLNNDSLQRYFPRRIRRAPCIR
jgi:hypothetical protein